MKAALDMIKLAFDTYALVRADDPEWSSWFVIDGDFILEYSKCFACVPLTAFDDSSK